MMRADKVSNPGSILHMKYGTMKVLKLERDFALMAML